MAVLRRAEIMESDTDQGKLQCFIVINEESPTGPRMVNTFCMNLMNYCFWGAGLYAFFHQSLIEFATGSRKNMNIFPNQFVDCI